ncbi:MAG: tetratricopeptide repeat protein [Armatimonadetes bacterium]|nr:tetratricopeptide repeat protein [Armatimonadota bacterium]
MSCTRWAALAAAGIAMALMAGCSTQAERLYNRAEAFFAQEQMQLAAQEYERLVKEYPRHQLADDALYKVAYIYLEELDKPSVAMVRYRMLADHYPQSSYVDDALLRIMDIQRRTLVNPGAVQDTCDELCARFPQRKRLCAQGMLVVASTWFDTGDYDKAAQAAQELIDRYPAQKRQCAQAALLIARSAEKKQADRDEVVALYEKIIATYPDTQSAATAKRNIGWIYYGAREEHVQQQRAEMRARSRVIQGVPPLESASGQIQALAALRSALAQRGEKRSMQEMIALSGVAFQVVFDPKRPALGQAIFPRNPFETIAERLGFAYNVWSSGDAAQAFDSVHQALLQGHPVIVLYGSPARWALVTGYDMEKNQVYYLPPERESYAATSKDRFLSRWGATGGGNSLAPGKFYQFSLAARLRTPPPAAVISDTLKQAAEVMSAGEQAGAAAGAKAFEQLAERLEQCADPEATQLRDQIKQWADTSLASRLNNAPAGTAELRRAADVISDASGRLAELADLHEEMISETQLLADKIGEAFSEQPPPDIWQTAAAQASFVAALHTRFTEQLTESLKQISG